MLLWIALACVLLVLPVMLRLAAGDEDPDNAIVHEQENAPRCGPGAAEMRLAA